MAQLFVIVIISCIFTIGLLICVIFFDGKRNIDGVTNFYKELYKIQNIINKEDMFKKYIEQLLEQCKLMNFSNEGAGFLKAHGILFQCVENNIYDVIVSRTGDEDDILLYRKIDDRHFLNLLISEDGDVAFSEMSMTKRRLIFFKEEHTNDEISLYLKNS